MWLRWALVALLVTAAAGRGKKNRHQKPGRAVFDRLSSTILSEVPAASENEGLLPPPLDVAPYASVAANATCGERGAEEFCRDTPGKRGVVCDVCEGDEGSSSRRHPATLAVDGDPATWWQSPTFSTGEEYHHVDLIATMPGKMDLLHVIIKSGPSPRPLAWSLEVSPTEGGDDWRLIRAFGDRDHCRKIWDLRPERRRRKARGAKRSSRAEKITCSTQFANMKPLENGEMHVGIGEGVPARRVRVSFRAAHGGMHQYYTVREMTLAARCLCHGHATRCAVDNKSVKCDCVHGTCGFHCQRCCSGAAWLPHQPCDPGESEKIDCSCGERGACSYDDTGAILCVNCTDNRAGPLCDKCLLGYYNMVPDGPCVACDCDPEGSDGTCKWDKKNHRIACDCRPGYTGALCDECEDQNAVFPNCALESTTAMCKCDPRGIVDPSRVCDDVCECKTHVVGERCDTCSTGYFGLSAALPMGCRPCYCSHMSTHCAEDLEPGLDVVLPLGDSWLISDNVTSETFVPSVDEQEKPYVISYEIEGWESFYWLSTTFNGDQLSIYGGEVRANLFWSVARGDSGGNPTVGPDFILLAQDGTRLSYANSSHESAGAVELSGHLVEDRWYADNEPVSRTELLDALRDLRGILIRAHYHFDQDEVRLESVEIKGSPAGVREVCSCPPGYEGAQCTRCTWTHVRLLRAPGSAPAFECVPCACNMHAACATVEGPCGECAHNTTGPHCERCLPGHYGNPVQGACKPCACPLYEASNNFSPNCALASADGDDFVCTQCPDGYAGDHCEICDSGFWGSPTTLGGSCAACDCGGGPCHPTTGRCLVCPPHTEGERCDQCQEGFWAGGENGSCVACECGGGALSAACELRTGRCACHPAWTGRACVECAPGYGDVEAGCPACRCGAAALDAACSPQTGACTCAAGAATPHCDTCQPDHYGFTADGCTSCNCSVAGSESNACDIRSGQCRCKPHVTGRACDTCEEGYWGLELGGCRRCECGAGAAACDPVSGLCACAAGVGGARCDRCLAGYYGFGPTGCLICPTCTDGRVCSPVTGRCVCPGRTRGPNCMQCARGYWRRNHACVPCACGPGSVTETCDVTSGQCHCRLGWSGPACDRCAAGYYGPRCRPCNCMPAGTRDCNHGVCACNQDGQCPCKENVVGEKCDSCLEGTFGLTETNPVGCTACFCFGRSAQCTQADVIRAALHASTPVHLKLLRGDIKTMDQDSLLAVHTRSPDATISVPWPAVPVYVELGELFLGDHLLSYGGALRFRVEEEGGEPLPSHTLSKFPLVSIYGAHLVLDYYQRVPAVNGTHAVHLHESLWEVRGRGAAASRSALMLVLQDVRRLLLRVSSRAPTRPDPVHVLLLSASMETAVAGVGRGASAPGVERCDCPREYDAASCQQPAPGFWMPPATPRVLRVSGTVVIRLDGAAQPCDCRGRANTCDPQSGHCLNCTDNTAGPQCERCADGYYGAPETGCLPCPCPGPARNNAAACSVSAGRVYCYCKPGYTGAACESCAVGWRAEGGACVACTCDPRGALDARCDASARCQCRAHATGQRCHQCTRPRHYLDDDGCKPCDNCTQTLLDSIEGLTKDLNARVDLLELSRVPQPFPAVREFSHNASLMQYSLQGVTKNFENFRLIERYLNNLEKGEHELFTNANIFKEEATKREKEARYLSLESMTGLDEVLKQKRLIADQVALLDDFARGEKHLSAHRALKEARHLLKKIKDMSLIDYVTSATDVSDSVNLQSTSIHEYKYRVDDASRRLQNILHGLDLWEAKADDLPKLAEVVWTAGDNMTELRKNIVPRMTALRDIGLKCRLVWEDITNLSSHNMTEDSRSALLQGQNLAISFPKLLTELQTLNAAAEEKEGILYNITPAYKEKYLDAVEKHAAVLSAKAKEYKNLFAGTRAVASAGVQAARAWAEVAEGVREAGAAANAATTAADTAGKLTRGPQPLLHTADQEKTASQELKKRGVQVLERAEDLRRSVESARRGTDAVSVGLRALGWQHRELTTAAAGAGVAAAAAQALRQATAQAERVFGGARALYDEAAETRRKIRYQLRRELTHLQRLGDTALGAAEEHVSQIRGNTVRGAEVSEALAVAAEARAREHSTAARQLSPATRDLRTRIQRAKDAAATISVSVTSPMSGAGCARAYSVWSGPSGTRAALAFSFDGIVRDGTLLYLPEQDTDRYLRLYVEGGRLRAKWDVGGGVGVVEHPEPLRATHDDADHAIYRVEIERVWGTVRLRVERAGSAAVVSSNSTIGSGGVGGLLRASRWWLGEADRPLPACVHALHSDRTKLGLWAFDTQPSTTRCIGCTQRWYSGSRGSDGLVWFNGAGYVALRRSTSRPSDRRRFSLSFTFRTLDHDALLFLALDTVNNRSVSVWVRSCRVVFRVQYAHARLDIAAGARHCDGKPAHVQATRLFSGLERGSLRVNGEETLGSPSPPVQSAAELPELSEAQYWIGGVPPGSDNIGFETPALLGCVGALTVDREGYDLLDTHARQGVESGCSSKPLRSAVLDGKGFIEVPSPIIKRKAVIGLTFQSRTESGVLLYRAPSIHDNEVNEDDDDKNYLLLVLVKGELELMAHAGKGTLRLHMNGTRLNDGRLHSVRLVRAHKQLEVWVDEKQLGAGTLPGVVFAARPRGLYLGGAPTDLGGPDLPAGAFVGTIADLIADSAWIGFEEALEWEGARLGRADGELRPDPPAEPRALQAQPDSNSMCTKTSSYTVEAGAVKFGDVPGSYATLRVGRSGAKGELTIGLNIRTFATEGLILLIPGSKAKPKHYTALMVKEGHLKLVVRGRKRRELSLPLYVADGTWRSVSVRAGRRRVVLRCGSSAAETRAAALARAARLYVGGPPPAPQLPYLPPAILRVGGFVGCIRRVMVNGRQEDLVGDARSHTAVGQCFPHIERGAYFAGDAYAVWSDKWWSEETESVEVRLQFRTHAPNGVLLAAGGVVLELRDGAVVVSGPGGRGTAVETGTRACDGAWHAVRARLARRPTLSLDAAPEERAPPALLPAPELPVRAYPLYVAGLPEGASELMDGRENFKGCIRDLVVGEEKRNWTAFESLHNVLLDSCPVSQ